MTPNEITTLLASQLGHELDIPFKLMLMKRVKYWRSQMIRRTLEKNDKERKFFRQSLLINVIRYNIFPCGSGGTCYGTRTVCSLPIPVRANNILFDYVGGVDGNSPFKYVEPGQRHYLTAGKYGNLFPIYEYENYKIQTDQKDLRKILIEGIFDDPEDVHVHTCACKDKPGDCDYWNDEFPMPGDITQLVIQSIIQIDFNRPVTPKDKEIEVSEPTPGR